MKTLILGGVRSGKSRLSERLALDSGLPVTVVATAAALDEEMRLRIAAHRARRPPTWAVVEEPLALSSVLAKHAAPGRCVLVDCLTLWLSNLLAEGDTLRRERDALLDNFYAQPGEIVLVANETNLGITPLGELSRRFCDEAGSLHQALAASCDNVLFTTAGIPQVLKGVIPYESTR